MCALCVYLRSSTFARPPGCAQPTLVWGFLRERDRTRGFTPACNRPLMAPMPYKKSHSSINDKKSWHVFKPENVARVLRDEAAHEADEAQKFEREQEKARAHRLSLLRARARGGGGGGGGGGGEAPAAGAATSDTAAQYAPLRNVDEQANTLPSSSHLPAEQPPHSVPDDRFRLGGVRSDMPWYARAPVEREPATHAPPSRSHYVPDESLRLGGARSGEPWYARTPLERETGAPASALPLLKPGEIAPHPDGKRSSGHRHRHRRRRHESSTEDRRSGIKRRRRSSHKEDETDM